MMAPIRTVSSTKPIISAKGALRVGLALLLAVFAAWTIYVSARDLLGRQAQANGQAALDRAVTLPRGASRDAQLASAQALASQGVSLAPDSAELWNLLGETNLLQATTAAVATISQDLLKAAADASLRAATLAPADPAPTARIAFVRSLQEDGKAQVGPALAQSYQAKAFDHTLGMRRLEAAGRAWPALTVAVRMEALGEACQLSRVGDGEQIYNLRMGDADPGMALELDRVMADPNCARQG